MMMEISKRFAVAAAAALLIASCRTASDFYTYDIGAIIPVELHANGQVATASPDIVRPSADNGQVVRWTSTRGRFVIAFKPRPSGPQLRDCRSPMKPAKGVWHCTTGSFNDLELGAHSYGITIYEGSSDTVIATGDPQVIVER